MTPSSIFVMRISDERLDEFIRGYEAAFKEPLSRDDARIMATRLLELYRVFLRRPNDAEAAALPIDETSSTRSSPRGSTSPPPPSINRFFGGEEVTAPRAGRPTAGLYFIEYDNAGIAGAKRTRSRDRCLSVGVLLRSAHLARR